MKFEKYDIADEIKANLIENGYFRTTDIQFKTIPAILNKEDVLAIAQTGTGKTAAFAIPIIARIHEANLKRDRPGVHCLVMVPTRELAQQIGKVFSKLSANTAATNYSVYGGVEMDQQIAQVAGGVDILIATPGRMFDLIRNGHLDVSSVKTLVLDEADRMMDLGFIDEIIKIKKMLRHRHQTLFFSATINKEIKKTAYDLIHSTALRIQVSPEEFVSKNVTHYIIRVGMDDKRHLLVNFLKLHPESKLIVFVRTQVRADRVIAHLAKNGTTAVGLHGGLLQNERDKNLERFRNEKNIVLVATELSARGIDLPGITHVINYDLPDDPENYVHRIGRTGRGFAKGDAISFVSPEENEKLALVEAFIETKITEIEVDMNKPVASEKEIEEMDIAEMLAFEESQFEPSKKKKKKH
ncbi:MAG: DEAD/DEAH box helicase [Bdellovibrionales bacterium]|nr:DEAD/DEAH box helicase [Bdellovibrionales bacterium]